MVVQCRIFDSLGGGLIPPESTQLSMSNGTEINITEVRVQVVEAVTPMILEELRNTFQANIEMQVEKHVHEVKKVYSIDSLPSAIS